MAYHIYVIARTTTYIATTRYDLGAVCMSDCKGLARMQRNGVFNAMSLRALLRPQIAFGGYPRSICYGEGWIGEKAIPRIKKQISLTVWMIFPYTQ